MLEGTGARSAAWATVVRRSGAKIRGVILYKVEFDFVRAPVPGVGVRAAWRGSEAILLIMQCRGRTGRVQWVRDAHESRTRESSCDDLNDVHQDTSMTCTNLKESEKLLI